MPVIKYQEFIPHTVLRDYVKRFWVLEKEYTAEDSVEEFGRLALFIVENPLLNGEVIRLDAGTRPPARTTWSHG